MTKEQEYRNEKRKILKMYLLGDLLMLVGGIMNAQDRFNLNLELAGAVTGNLGGIIFFIGMMKRWRSAYQNLEDEVDDDNASLKEMVSDFGTGMIIGAGIIAFCLIACGLIFLWFLAHFNWFKAFLFLIAFQLVSGLRDFSEVNREDE